MGFCNVEFLGGLSMLLANIDKIEDYEGHKDKPDITTETSHFLKSARIEKSLTGTELGKLLNLSQQQISRYENGLCKISVDMLNNYLKVLDKDWSDYFYSVISNKFSRKF